jgi:hypothetical protein
MVATVEHASQYSKPCWPMNISSKLVFKSIWICLSFIRNGILLKLAAALILGDFSFVKTTQIAVLA